MKKIISFLALIAVILSITSCGNSTSRRSTDGEAEKSASGSAADRSGDEYADEPRGVSVEALASSRGEHAVSDGEYIYFTVHSDDDAASIAPETDGLYRATLSLEDPVRLARGDCHSLVLDGGSLYFIMEDVSGDCAVCSIDLESLNIRRIIRDVDGATDLGICGGHLFYVYMSELCYVDDMESGKVSTYSPESFNAAFYTVFQAQSSADGKIWLSAQNSSDLSVMLYTFDPEEGKPWGVAGIGSRFTVADDGTVYFTYPVEGQPDYEDYRQYEYLLMKMEDIGEVSSMNFTGRFSGDFFSYGNYLFYTKYTEVEEKAGEGASTARKLYCYDTQTGEEYAIDRDAFVGIDISIRGITCGRLFYNTYEYFSPQPDDEEFCDCRSCDLTDADGTVTLNTLVASATDTQALLADDEITERQIEEREREREEELKNEPYGPGTSSLYLTAGNRMACYRLVRMDGSTEFQVLLSAGEETTQSFPCGRYVLKVARGDEWISDEEAFGDAGSYSSTNTFKFEDGGYYEISTGTQGSFYGDSKAGFTQN